MAAITPGDCVLPSAAADVHESLVMRRPLLAVVLVGLVLRLALLALAPSALVSDAPVYEGLAWRMAQGLGYTTAAGQPTAFMPPLYPMFAAALYAVAGREHLVVYLVQALLGALVAAAVYEVARLLTARRDVAMLAAMLCAVDSSLVAYPRLFLSENLFVPLVALAMVFWARAWRGDRLVDWALFGVTTGLATLTRPTIEFLPLVAVAAWPFGVFRARLALDRRAIARWITVAAVVFVAVVATLTPWIVRNARAFGFVTAEITSTSGTGLFLSYFPTDGWRYGVANTVAADRRWLEGLQMKYENDRLSEWRRSVYLKGETMRYLREHPTRVMTMMPLKLGYLLWPYEWGLFEGVRALDVVYVVVLPFALFGLLRLSHAGGWRATAPLWLVLAYTVAITVVFLGAPRYRVPIQPYLHVFAAVGLLAWAEGQRYWRAWLIGWTAAVLVVALVDGGMRQTAMRAVRALTGA